MIPTGGRVKVSFEGDVFEMEDQRNWTDASFNTYSTPLELPYPVEIAAGKKVSQTVIIELLDYEHTEPSRASVKVPLPPHSQVTLNWERSRLRPPYWVFAFDMSSAADGNGDSPTP